jgi:hypothetical protein
MIELSALEVVLLIAVVGLLFYNYKLYNGNTEMYRHLVLVTKTINALADGEASIKRNTEGDVQVTLRRNNYGDTK